MLAFSDLPITRKLVAVMLLTSITALALSSLMQAATEGIAYRENRVEYLRTIADMIGTNSAAAITFDDSATAQQLIGSLKADPSIVEGSVVDARGEVLATYRAAMPGLVPVNALSAGADLLAAATAGERAPLRWTGLESLEIVQAIDFDGETIGYVYLRVSLEPLVDMLVRFAWMTTAIVLLTAVLIVVLSARLQRVISKPILALAELMRRVTRDGDYSLRAEPSGRDEVGLLINGFNNMLTQISERDQRLVEQNLKIDDQARNLVLANRQLTETIHESVEAREAAEAASRAKSQFLARMSHEIRTPMNGVLGMTELLVSSGLESKQRHFAETIQTSAESLLTLINDILDFSKIEAGRLELENVNFDLRSLVENKVELLSAHAQGKNIELLCDLGPGLPTSVRGDPTRLGQILTNLVGNAIKFTEEGEVLVRVRTPSIEGNRAVYRFEVTDSGIGIRPENQAMIFELFSQEDDSTTRRYGGTGLGLAICRQLVELMGGQIGVDSAVGRGSTFWLTVPLTITATQRASSALPALTTHLPLHVLVVDDNATNREILQLQLEAWGLQVDQVDSAPAALERLHDPRLHYDVAILDWHMPEVSGLELARSIRADAGLNDLRLIMLSSAAADDAVRMICKAGIDVYTSKPVRQSRLLECLQQALEPAPDSGDIAASQERPDEMATVRTIGGRVLLVEDNPVNREVAVYMLQTLLFDVDIAVNGQEAVRKVQHGEFDVVLMDCEMPVMDGYAATVSIRAWEAGVGGGRHVPILALTAHALAEDRRRCLEIGMDDYLTKPFNMEQLRERISKWVRVAALPSGAERPAKKPAPRDALGPVPQGNVIRFRALESIVALDPENGEALLGRLLAAYEETSIQLVAAISRALAGGATDDLRKGAHALKSSSGNVGAERLFDLCRNLEDAVRNRKHAALPGLVQALQQEHGEVVEELRHWRRRRIA